MNIRNLSTAIRTLTVFPMPGRDTDNFADSLSFFPLVGAMLGLFSAAVAVGLGTCRCLPHPDGTAFAILAFTVWATRGLHLDGVADCADGFWGGNNRQRTLAIMKDSAIGAFGAIAVSLVLLGKWIALRTLASPNHPGLLILAMTLPRYVQVDLAVWLPYARDEGGTGQGFVAGAGIRHRIAALLVAAVIAVIAVGPTLGLGFLAGSSVLGRILGFWFRKRVGGVTGDLLGAASEITETCVMLALAGMLSAT